jgi:hypothetical protein
MSAQIELHCAACNKLFKVISLRRHDVCEHCGSEYSHVADSSCREMVENEWKSLAKITSTPTSIPDSTGNSTTNYIMWPLSGHDSKP